MTVETRQMMREAPDAKEAALSAPLGRRCSAHHRKELPTRNGLSTVARPREYLEETDHLDQTEEET